MVSVLLTSVIEENININGTNSNQCIMAIFSGVRIFPKRTPQFKLGGVNDFL